MQTNPCACPDSQHRFLSSVLTSVLATARALNWNDAGATARFAIGWSALRSALSIPMANVGHELIDARITKSKRDIERRLFLLDALVDAAQAEPTSANGTRVERELSAFVSAFFVYLLDVELIALPAARRRAL